MMNAKRSAALLALAAGLHLGPAHAVDLEMDDSLEDLTRAKVAKQRTKQNMQRRSVNEDSAGEGSSGCGNIDIGNSQGGRPGFSGPKEIIVVVKGDIINSNNKCKD
jgi:hypothetical protein